MDSLAHKLWLNTINAPHLLSMTSHIFRFTTNTSDEYSYGLIASLSSFPLHDH